MTLQAGDIRFARSVNMSDVPEGGGPPSDQLLTSGNSNEIFNDPSEDSRTNGRVEIVQLHSTLRNPDTDPLLGSNTIIAEPPADPNVSIVMLTLGDPFATRADIARRIESSMTAASEFSGYLLENVYTTMRAIQIFQRPGLAPPAIGKTLELVYNEGLDSERRQRVRVVDADPVVRIFTELVGGQLLEFEGQVVTCVLDGALRFDFPGSPPSRFYGRQDTKSLIRETVYSDSGMFYSATRLTAPVLASDVWLPLESVYVQLVPNTRTEVPSTDQRPGARRTITLAEAPRKVEMGLTPHTLRIKVGEENSGLNYVEQLRPLPQDGTLEITYYSLGQRYTIYDDGTGRLTGAGGGAVSAATGSLVFTLKALADIGTNIAISWGSPVAYTNRVSQGAQVRPPEFSSQAEGTDNDQVVPGSFVLKYPSAGQIYTVTDDGNGNLTGAGTGHIDYASRLWVLRPSHMPDAGAQFAIDYDLDAVVTELFAAPGVDGAGMALFNLAQQPAAKSLQLTWATGRTVSATSGATLDTSNSIKNTTVGTNTRYVQDPFMGPPSVVPPGVNWTNGGNGYAGA